MQMTLLNILLLLFCLVCIASSSPSWTSEWRQISRASPDTVLLVHVGIKQQNTDLLEKILLDISTPSSPNYGKHLTHDEVNRLVAPTEKAYMTVVHWLNQNGIYDFDSTPNGDMLEFTIPVHVMERLFNAKYYVFSHTTVANFSVVRSPEFTIPDEIFSYVDFVGPSTRFPQPQLLRKTQPSPQVGVTPDFLRNLYNLGNFTSTAPSTQQAVTGFLEQYISLTDLSKFFANYDHSSVGRVPNIVGPNSPRLPGTEASLDIQYVMAMGHGINTTFWSTAGRQPGNDQNEPFLVWLYDVANATNPPTVFSISYGDNEDSVDYSYAVRCNVEFQKAGARGITIMASSGDGGVAGSQSTPCKKFIPNFPAASPWITAVGGTEGSNPEKGVYFSSGGFSDRWAPASYQEPFITQYFKVANNLPASNRYNASGAGFPDVAAQGVNFIVVIDGESQGVSGTSCSSPTFAGIVASLNAVRLGNNKSTLGFLNPLLYSNPGAFNDITSGNNPGCSTEGFYAAKGWDPITGLGTPDFEKLKTVVSNLN